MSELAAHASEPAIAPSVSPRHHRRVQVSERLAIAGGGVLGAYLRVIVAKVAAPPGDHWPWSTFIVNIGGAFLLGYFTTRLLERLPPSTYRRPFLATGFCGALTTFSTLQFELLNLIRAGHIQLAIAYGTTSVIVGFAAFLFAVFIVRRARVVR